MIDYQYICWGGGGQKSSQNINDDILLFFKLNMLKIPFMICNGKDTKKCNGK